MAKNGQYLGLWQNCQLTLLPFCVIYFVFFPLFYDRIIDVETSIAFYIGLGDLMYAGNAIRAATYSAFMPLVAVAIIYFIMVLVLSKLVSLLERRLRNNER